MGDAAGFCASSPPGWKSCQGDCRPKKQGRTVRLRKTVCLPFAVILLSLGGANLALAQDQAATPQDTPAAMAAPSGTPAATPPAKPLSTKQELQAIEDKNQDLETRLKALEDEVAAQKSATPEATPNPENMVGPEGATSASAYMPGVHENTIEFRDTNEYMYSESRYLSFTNPEGSVEFRLGGYDWTDLDINNQTGTVSGGVTTYNYLNGSTANGFIPRKAHLDFRTSFDKFVEGAIGIESDKSTEVSIGVYHAYAVVKFDPMFTFQAGKMTNPLSLEGLQPSADLPFVEASMIANLTVNKTVGAEIEGQDHHFFDYVLEIDNGAQDNESSATGPGKPSGDFKDLTGRIFFTPWVKTDDAWLQGLGFGGGASVDNETNEDTAVWSKLDTSIGGNAFMTYSSAVKPNGAFYHVDGQGYYYKDAFGFLGEWVQSIQSVSQGDNPAIQLANTAWLTEVQWVFGGKAGFEGATVDHPFDLDKGQWGALELVARMDCNYLDVRSFTIGFPYAPIAPMGTGSQVAIAYGVGFNWWLNENFKFMCDGEETDFSGGNATTLPEQIMVARAALTI